MARDKTTIRRKRTKRKLKEFKNPFYLSILQRLKSGSNPEKIAKQFDKSIQNIQYYISKLQEGGYIRKVGYGTWELTKLGDYVTTKKFIWGSQERPRKIELWRMGYRFYLRHDNDIPELREQILKTGGKVYKGHVLGCWLMKGKETLDIYGTVAKSDNLWDAAMTAMTEIIACKGHVEDTYKLTLEPMNPLRPDIIINTPETRKVANKVYEELGRMRSEFVDVDTSKTGEPEFEARTLESAANVLDNLAAGSKVDKFEKKLDRMAGTLETYAKNLELHMSVMNNINEAVKQLGQLPGIIQGRISPPAPTTPPEETKPRREPVGLEKWAQPPEVKPADDALVEIEALENTGDFLGFFKGDMKTYNLKKGAKIHLEYMTANNLVRNGLARFTRLRTKPESE
jgi:DNA-binding transcriptional ArsR family regulator